MVKKLLSILLLGVLTVFPCVSCGESTQETGNDNSIESSVEEQKHIVILDKAEITLIVGETQVLTASVSPISASAKPRGWRSSDGSIATVDGTGTVVAKKEGTAVITVTVDGVSAQCTVTVVGVDVE